MIGAADQQQQRAGASVSGVALLLLACMLVQWSFGPASVLRLYHVRHDVKARILHGLAEEQLTTLHFSGPEVAHIEWMDGGREVRAYGHLFDIVTVNRLPDGSMEVRAWRDDQEGHVLAELDREVRFAMGQDARTRDLGSRIISAWAAFCHGAALPALPIPLVADRAYGDHAAATQWVHMDVDPGPPRMS